MAKKTIKAPAKQELPFTRRNYQLFGVGIVTIVLGYIALAQMPVDGFLSLTLAPILLAIGYLVIIPVSIMYREKPKEGPAPAAAEPSRKV